MLVFWLLFDDEKKVPIDDVPSGNVPQNLLEGKIAPGFQIQKIYDILKLFYHTLIAKSLLYFSVALFCILSLISLASSVIICGIAHTIWFLSRVTCTDNGHMDTRTKDRHTDNRHDSRTADDGHHTHDNDAPSTHSTNKTHSATFPSLSTEACDALETELILREMKTGKHIQSDWQHVDVRTDCGLECTMLLHSLIYTGEESVPEKQFPEHSQGVFNGDDKISEEYVIINNIDSDNNNKSDHDGNSRSDADNRKRSNINGNNDSFTEDMDSDRNPEPTSRNTGETRANDRGKKGVLLWLHGAGGTAALSFGLSGVIDRLGEEYDVRGLWLTYIVFFVIAVANVVVVIDACCCYS